MSLFFSTNGSYLRASAFENKSGFIFLDAANRYQIMELSNRVIFLILSLSSLVFICYFNASFSPQTRMLTSNSLVQSSQSDALPSANLSEHVVPIGKDWKKNKQVGKWCSLFNLSSVQKTTGFKKFAGCGYIYSSYYDDRLEDAVRVVAFGYGNCSEFQCSIWYNTSHCVMGRGASRSTK